MSHPVISVENLSKAYRIGLKEEVPDTLTSALIGLAKAPLRKFQELRKLDTFRQTGDAEDIVWALKDVSFEVHEGEVLGVIGRNGAGKSTLLKILSRITEPTSGRAVIRGRVSSLLEVGTGFHPELSGRENVYLNGTILGMTKAEIDRKFDEIVDFSGVEKFLDTPIKRYSSGMKVRLAFAVAAHLEPEILIIDEVLAVGDAAFQQKCMQRMRNVATLGTVVLFVSHNLGAVRELCSTGIVLMQGQKVADGSAEAAVDAYLNGLIASSSPNLAARSDRSGRGAVRIADVNVDSEAGMEHCMTGAPMSIGLKLSQPSPGLVCVLSIFDELGRPVLDLRSRPETSDDERIDAPLIRCRLPQLPLVAGQYRIDVELWSHGVLEDAIEAAAVFTVTSGSFDGRFVETRIRQASATTAQSWTLPG
uniref:ABC transporter ATP-binding protein n=1 Tax=Schlesneria paludicola TaxID=360056 RepID=A0A7C2JZI0_9PLAN